MLNFEDFLAYGHLFRLGIVTLYTSDAHLDSKVTDIYSAL